MQQDRRTLQLIRDAKERDNYGNYTDRANRAFERLLSDALPDLKKVISRLYIEGSDREDILQEARIGFMKAVNDFDEQGGASFKNFAINLCIKRHLVTQILQAHRKKYKLQREARWLSAPIRNSDGDVEQTLEDLIEDENCRPIIKDMLIDEEYATLKPLLVAELTELEEAVFHERASDSSYRAIAENLDVHVKKVDNAIMRIKKKAKKIYENYLDNEQSENERIFNE